MFFFHSIGIYFLGIALFLAKPFHKKVAEWWNGRKNFWKQLPDTSQRKVVWFHCASLGEFDQGIPVMKKLKEQDNSIFLMVTFFSPSGMNHYHKRQHPADWVGYLPLPTYRNAKKFIRYFQPSSVFFVKYDFWANYLYQAKKYSAKLYCISANFRENQAFFGWFKRFFNPVLFLFDLIFVQNEKSAQLLHSIGYKRVVVVGDTRIDKVLENKNTIQPDDVVIQFLNDKKAIILGSSWPIGEEKWVKYIQDNPTKKFIIAPHDVSENHIQSLQQKFPNATRYTKFDSNKENSILLVDCIGKLSNLYQYAELAYVGGGFTGSLHNILEPAVFGVPILIGPKHDKFPEADTLIQEKVVFEITSSEDIENQIHSIDFEMTKEQASAYFEKNKEVSQKIIDAIQ